MKYTTTAFFKPNQVNLIIDKVSDSNFEKGLRL